MKPEAQRIAIAEACGWTIKTGMGGTHGFKPGYKMFECAVTLPDYLNSLDAMHKAEKLVLENSGTWTRYVTNLKEQSAASGIPVFHLSASQRAKAFLRTLNLWTE